MRFSNSSVGFGIKRGLSWSPALPKSIWDNDTNPQNGKEILSEKSEQRLFHQAVILKLRLSKDLVVPQAVDLP